MKYLHTLSVIAMLWMTYTEAIAQSCSGTATFNVTINPTPTPNVLVGGNSSGGGTIQSSYQLPCASQTNPSCKVYLKSSYTNTTNFTLKWYKNNNELTQYQNYLGGYVKKNGVYKLKVIRNSTGCEAFSQTVTITGGLMAMSNTGEVANTDATSNKNEEEIFFDTETMPMGLELYPNPANDIVTINYDLGSNTVAHLEVYDILGRVQTTQTINLSEENTLQLNLSNYTPGTYIVQIIGDTGSVTRHLTITR